MSISNLVNGKNNHIVSSKGLQSFTTGSDDDLYIGVENKASDNFGYYVSSDVTAVADQGLTITGKDADGNKSDTPMMTLYSEVSNFGPSSPFYQKPYVVTENLMSFGEARLGKITNSGSDINWDYITGVSGDVYLNDAMWNSGGVYHIFLEAIDGQMVNIYVTDLAIQKGGTMKIYISALGTTGNRLILTGLDEVTGLTKAVFPTSDVTVMSVNPFPLAYIKSCTVLTIIALNNERCFVTVDLSTDDPQVRTF